MRSVSRSGADHHEAPVIAGEWKVDGTRSIKLEQASADYAQKDFTPEQSLDGQDKTGWAVGEELGRAHSAVFQTATPITTPGGETILTFSLVQKFGQQHLLGTVSPFGDHSERTDP